MHEIAIEWEKDKKVATVSAYSNSKLKGKMLRYANEYPDEVDVKENKDGSIVGHVPIKWVKVSPPRKVSEEQRIAAGERLRKFHEKNGE